MSLVLLPIIETYRTLLAPIAPFTWFGLPITALDVLAATRLCVGLRQFKEKLHNDHLTKLATLRAQGRTISTEEEVEERSFLRDAAATLTVVYGGEIVTGPSLGVPPSFMLSPVGPALYTGIQALVNQLPAVPTPSLNLEFALAFLDGLSRTFLLCDLNPPVVLQHVSPAVAASPWTLLLTSTIITNAGFFLTNLFSLFQPYAMRTATPAELLPYGWSAPDFWCPAFITGLYALLTHAQPFWADAHATALGFLGADGEKAESLDKETARAVCAVVLMSLFATRAVRTYAPTAKVLKAPKTKVQ